jgi:hypothetical protein
MEVAASLSSLRVCTRTEGQLLFRMEHAKFKFKGQTVRTECDTKRSEANNAFDPWSVWLSTCSQQKLIQYSALLSPILCPSFACRDRSVSTTTSILRTC